MDRLQNVENSHFVSKNRPNHLYKKKSKEGQFSVGDIKT